MKIFCCEERIFVLLVSLEHLLGSCVGLVMDYVGVTIECQSSDRRMAARCQQPPTVTASGECFLVSSVFVVFTSPLCSYSDHLSSPKSSSQVAMQDC